ncbi:unnamed protein product [Rhizoctonia solani]|uniref:DUF7587 domain-containing protein n=3 Tax=Rhizoctonia solani TaxID=456999 RepID=A0A8H2XAI2_9AGAM|nr:hypothetical protein RSOL_035370 [Rhizoctonia solani AG-3 Rhs1AP]KEP46129.1 hypothetical protein V565_217230 [Rhizoctonia solani 123E]CAE6417380.1 unnamed protein product [Rhizoctonia solani]
MPHIKKLLPGIFDRKKASKDDLDYLMGQTRFLYRVFTHDCRSPRTDDGFIAHKYRDSGPELNIAQLLLNDDTRYRSALMHIENDENTPWISTTRVWDWAMWKLMSPSEKMEGARVAIIDLLHFPQLALQGKGTLDLSLDRFQGQIVHALDAINRLELQKSSAAPLSSDMVQRARDRANSADEVLVYAMIPSSAIVSTFSLQDIQPSVPPTFVADPIAEPDYQKSIRRRLQKVIKIKDDINSHKQQIGLFRQTRHAWIKRLDKEKWDTEKHGHKVTDLAYAFLKERATQIGLTLPQLDNMLNPNVESGQNTSSEIAKLNKTDRQTPDGTGREEIGDDRNGSDAGSASSAEVSIQLADLIGQVGVYEMDADTGSLTSLVSAYSRLTTSSKDFSSQESLAAAITEPTESTSIGNSLLINLSMLPKNYHGQKFGSIDRPTEISEAVGLPLRDSDPKSSDVQRSINIFCDQLLILSSSILEPYWNIKQRKIKDWEVLKHAIVESTKPKVWSLEKRTTGVGEVAEIHTGVIFDKFEKNYPPYQWIAKKPASKGKRASKKEDSRLR